MLALLSPSYLHRLATSIHFSILEIGAKKQCFGDLEIGAKKQFLEKKKAYEGIRCITDRREKKGFQLMSIMLFSSYKEDSLYPDSRLRYIPLEIQNILHLLRPE